VTTSGAAPSARQSPGLFGWVVFAAAMLLVGGVYNVVSGLVAIVGHDVYVSTARTNVVWDVTAWGWVHLVVGVAIAACGLFLLQGALWAQVAAAALVMLNLVTQMLLLPAFPFWSLLIIAVDVVVLWALFVHAEEDHGADRAEPGRER